MKKRSVFDTFELVWKCTTDYKNIHAIQRTETENYLKKAVVFFEQKYNCKIKCAIKYYEHGSFMFQGSYYPLDKSISIYGLGIYTNRELATTLFHELVHYWQHNVVKTLAAVTDIDHGFCQNDGGYRRRKKKNNPVRIFYSGKDTSTIEYENQPHEIEARELSAKLIKEYEATI